MSIEPKDKAITIRQPATALLLVNSDDQQLFDVNGFRIDSTTPGRIYINNQRPLLFGYMTRLALTEMNIQWDTPNVNSSNNTLTLALYSATDATPPVVGAPIFTRITIVPDFYQPTDLAEFLQTAILASPEVIAAGLLFDVGYDQIDGNFTIQQTQVYPSGNTRGYFKIFSSSAPQSLTGLQRLDDDILYCIGVQPVTKPGAEPTGFYTQITGAYAPMLYTPYIDVVSNLLTKHQNVSDGTTASVFTSSKLARVYFSNETIINRHDNLPIDEDSEQSWTTVCNIVGTRPITFRREFITPKQIQWENTENVDFIDIQVLDYKGNPIRIEEDLTIESNATTNAISFFQKNNTSFQFTLMATES